MTHIFDYQQYREYLKDYYSGQKKQGTGFTYARFSSFAGLKSPNYLKLVMDGQKNLTPENIVRFSRALKFTDHESDYFEALVHFNQAKKSLEREYYSERMKRVKKRYLGGGTQERTLEEYEFETISNWLHHTVMLLTNVKGFRESPAWIRERLFNLASEQEIVSILERLTELKLLVRNDSGKLVQSHRQLKTKPELRRLSARMFYEGLLSRGIQSFKLSEPEEREFGTELVGLSPKQIPELKKRVRDFMKSLNEWALENPAPLQIYSLGFSGFPLTSIEGRHQQ